MNTETEKFVMVEVRPGEFISVSDQVLLHIVNHTLNLVESNNIIKERRRLRKEKVYKLTVLKNNRIHLKRQIMDIVYTFGIVALGFLALGLLIFLFGVFNK